MGIFSRGMNREGGTPTDNQTSINLGVLFNNFGTAAPVGHVHIRPDIDIDTNIEIGREPGAGEPFVGRAHERAQLAQAHGLWGQMLDVTVSSMAFGLADESISRPSGA